MSPRPRTRPSVSSSYTGTNPIFPEHQEVLFDSAGDTTNFTSATPLQYITPTPPAGDGPHSYTVMMFNQPQGFSLPSAFASFFVDKSDLSNRLNFDIASFVLASGLGAPVAANWFEVQNGTAVATTSSATSMKPTSTFTSASRAASSSTTSTTLSTTESVFSTTSTIDSSSTTPTDASDVHC